MSSGYAQPAHVTDVEEAAALSSLLVFLDDRSIQHGHFPACEIDHFCALFNMEIVKGRPMKGCGSHVRHPTSPGGVSASLRGTSVRVVGVRNPIPGKNTDLFPCLRTNRIRPLIASHGRFIPTQTRRRFMMYAGEEKDKGKASETMFRLAMIAAAIGLALGALL